MYTSQSPVSVLWLHSAFSKPNLVTPVSEAIIPPLGAAAEKLLNFNICVVLPDLVLKGPDESSVNFGQLDMDRDRERRY